MASEDVLVDRNPILRFFDFYKHLIFSMGYKNFAEMITSFFLPVTVISGLILIVIYVTDFIPKFFLLLGFIFYVLFLILYPIYIYFNQISDIKSNLIFFISYVATLSTLQISRTLLFKKVSMNKKFGYLSEIATRLIYFSKSWNLGFSTASRSIKRLIPYEPLVDFFDRLATISDFGEDVEVFFLEEQESMMDELVAEYNKTYENIKMIQELFTSFIVTMAFILAVLLLLPILTGASMDELIRTVTYIVFLIDAALIVVVRTLVPKDDIVHNLPIYDEYITRSNLAFLIVTPFCAILIAIIGFLFIPQLPFLVVIALGITPLFIPAILSIEAENKIMKRDNSFPAFIRTLGGAVEARGGGMVSTLDALRIHHFGEINEIFLRLFKRLRLGNDKFESWLYFGAESGSNLIYNFSQIFAETVYLGAKADTISDIISKNFQKILSLRKLKFQLTSALRGTFYGALVGFASAGYIGLEISTRLASTFSGPMSSISDPSISGDLQSIFPEVPEINLFLISSYVGIMIIFHAIATSYVLKIVNGSYRYSFFFDLIMMIWIGALMSWTVPFIMARVLPSMGAGATQVLTPF